MNGGVVYTRQDRLGLVDFLIATVFSYTHDSRIIYWFLQTVNKKKKTIQLAAISRIFVLLANIMISVIIPFLLDDYDKYSYFLLNIPK